MIAFENHRQISFPPPLSAEQEAALNRARLAGDEGAREQLILSNLRLVLHLSRRYTWGGIAQEDLFSAGVTGLIAAVDTFDADRGRLATHARMHIRKEMLNVISTQRSLLHLPSSVNYHAMLIARAEARLATELGREPGREEIAAACGLSERRVRVVQQALAAMVSLDDMGEEGDEGLSLHDQLADEQAECGQKSAASTSRAEWLHRALGRLSPREKRLLMRHFGLDGRGGAPLAQLAHEMSVSRERLRQIEIAALRKLRRWLDINGAAEHEALGQSDWLSMLREAGFAVAT